MGRDAVDHHRVFAVLRRDFDTQLDVRSLMLVCEHLANVVQQRTALRQVYVQFQLGRHDACEPGHFLRMPVHVLAV